ncbi:MOSC domain-containing protein [Peribacillus asahii]|uniref:MOSC domain-containing protein n=1 Tax=Peribacillus asahii TaxID=228899 RepID=A0A398B8J7_9BACI|nr:MOSC domain-containing protein [Peribacillus asahii]RID86192.1 MOSC domain-containing protein [Peribacillus asahii]
MKVVALNIGKPITVEYNGKALTTGIFKKPSLEPVFLGKLNFEGDGQADLVNHGGADKAVCVYPYEHYVYWEETISKDLGSSAFGENLTLQGMLEPDIHIGDIYQVGEAVVQVSQPREPCFKVAKKHGVPDLALQVQNTGYTGYYFRVLKEGLVQADSKVQLIEKDSNQISIQFANNIMHHDKSNREAIQQILAVEALSDSWRETFMKRLAKMETDQKTQLKETH